MLITIRERAPRADGFDAEIAFDNDPPYQVQVKWPFDAQNEERRQWYFEVRLEQPYLNGVKAKQAAHSVREYGEALFKMLFADPDAYSYYKQGWQTGVANRRVEIIGSPDFHRLHWEALRDPKCRFRSP